MKRGLFLCIVFLFAANTFAQESQQTYVSILNDSCDQQYDRAKSDMQGSRWIDAYSKFKLYIETCYAYPSSFHAFGNLDFVNQNRSNDLNRYPEHREWLKKVLYYSPDTSYYCSDVNSILATFHWFDSARGRDFSGAIAVAGYIITSGKCPQDSEYLAKGIIEERNSWYKNWQDSVSNPDLTPFDSTLPSLEDLDLGILLGQNKVTEPTGSYSRQIVSDFRAETNPFSDETVFRFELGDAAFVKIEISDILGKRLYGYGGRLFNEGENSITVAGKGLPDGILFARLSTLSGEIKTIQLRHY